MSGLEVGLAVAPVVFKLTIASWKVIDDTLSFTEDAQDLAVRVERAKGLLTIWASQSGLTEGTLLPALRPLDEVIARTLDRIKDLILDLKRDGKKYGLSSVTETQSDERRVASAAIFQMRRSLHAIVRNSSVDSDLWQLLDQEASQQSGVPIRSDTVGVVRKVFWSLRDRQKFEQFVDMLEKHIGGLRDLLQDTQAKEMQLQLARLDFQVIQGLSEVRALLQIQGLFPATEPAASIRGPDIAWLAKAKTLTLDKGPPLRTPSPKKKEEEEKDWDISTVDVATRLKPRFLKVGQADRGACYLFEKKEYDPNTTDAEKELLRERIKKLVLLLGGTGAQRHLHTCEAVGYADDPEHYCWWIVFRFPIATGIPSFQGLEPLSLRQLYISPKKPALEIRYRLASRLADTFSKLYGSAWMHKSVNSNNILFPQLGSPETANSFRSLHTALVQGFGYSRQYTEAQTIDRGKVVKDLEDAIYRHPNYQGDAASGYQIHYDIYSLGLVLFEIGLWIPLSSLLEAKPQPGRTPPPVILWPGMNRFHEPEARELKRRVDMRMEREMAYRMGTKYKRAVEWCLSLPGPVQAVEFYDEVVVPLQDISSLS
ncbi:Prion-inhibition and propagation domain containing protein [Rhypophila decipiens]